MKVLAISDLHGHLEGLDISKADIICIAGDIAPLKGFSRYDFEDQADWVKEELIPWMSADLSKTFVIIPGNHDFFSFKHKIKWPKNCYFLVDSGCEVNGITFYGTPWVPIINHRWAFEGDHDKLRREFAKIPEGIDILLSHCPPHISNESKIDRSTQFYVSDAFGSYELAEEIMRKKPRYSMFGHIHTGDHSPTLFCDTQLFNVSRIDERYEIAYEPLLLDIEAKADVFC